MAAAGHAKAGLRLVQCTGEDDRELVAVSKLAVPDPDVHAPVCFLGHWDAALGAFCA